MDDVIKDPKRPNEQVEGIGQKCRLPFFVDAVADELEDPADYK